MGLDWSALRAEFGDGGAIPTVAGGKTLTVERIDDEYVYIRHSLWRDRLAREHLETAARLIEAGAMTRVAGLFPEDYRAMVADVRATSVAHVLKYVGLLE